MNNGTDRYECLVCGYISNPTKGDLKGDLPRGHRLQIYLMTGSVRNMRGRIGDVSYNPVNDQLPMKERVRNHEN